MRRIAALLALLSLSGCLIGPDYERPPPATPTTPEYKETSDSLFRPAQPRDTVDRGPWWNIYSDPTLDQLTAQVEVSHPNRSGYVAWNSRRNGFGSWLLTKTKDSPGSSRP